MVIETGSGTWLTVHSPFSGDSNMNGYTVYEFGVSPQGPWTPVCGSGTPGESEWRQCLIPDLTPEASYYVRTTFHDPDGVAGSNLQVSGAIWMPDDVATAVTVHTATVTVEDTHLLVSLPVTGDSDRDSLLQSVEIAPSSHGPWTQRCGPAASFAPKLCRIHGLIQGSEYWLRITVSDPDGVGGSNPQLLGPVHYTGLTDLAAGRAVTADPGWGCCPDSAQLVDGRIQYPNWNYGFAWAGGLDQWGGGVPGWKAATVDLGSLKQVGRVDWWPHDSGSIPTTWQIEVSTDGITYTPVFATSEFRCRTETGRLRGGWDFPACYHSARFRQVTARYVRYGFDDRTILEGLHGWSVELEVFADGGSWLYLPLIVRNHQG